MPSDDEVEIDLSEVPESWFSMSQEEKEAEAEKDWGIAPEPKKLDLPPHARAYLRKVLKWTPDVLAMPPPEWFIDGLVEAGPVTVLHGQSGTKKSMILLDWMLCAATGTPWHGRHIRPGKCLYVVAEGLRGMGKRVLAWAQTHEVDTSSLNITFMSEPLNLYKLDADQIANWRTWNEFAGYDYIVFDTLHMCSSGADENSNKEMGTVFSNAKQVAGRANVFIAHHDPKEGKSARGAGAIRDDSDQCLSLVKTGPLTSQLQSDRQKDAGDFKPIDIEFTVVETPLGFSLATTAVVNDANPATRQNTAVDKCVQAITEHELDIKLGQVAMKAELHKLEYIFGAPTVGAALRKLRKNQLEVDKLVRNRNYDAAGRPKDVS